jgi:hypothetical protein
VPAPQTKTRAAFGSATRVFGYYFADFRAEFSHLTEDRLSTAVRSDCMRVVGSHCNPSACIIVELPSDAVGLRLITTGDFSQLDELSLAEIAATLVAAAGRP